jgi:glycosyltransferase involved in cell wall biosynthesis
MPKILRIINRFNLGGITYNVSYLSRYLPAEYTTLLAGGPEEENEESSLFIPRGLGLEPLIIEELRRSINPLSDYLAYRRIKKLIRTFRPDIVHTHASKAGAIGRLAAASCGVPVIVHTFHGHVFKGYFGVIRTSFFKAFERYLAGKSTAIIAISNLQKDELANVHRICDRSKIHVIPLGFDLARFRADMEEKRKAFRQKYNLSGLCIGIIGRLAPIKNHYLFIDAVIHISKTQVVPVTAVIIGDGEMRNELKQYIINKGSSYSEGRADALFLFTSWVREADVALAGVDIVCLTSKNEGTPVSLIEAQAASRLIVSTDVGGVKDILHMDAGLLSAPGDDRGFTSNLENAVRNFEALSRRAGTHSDEIMKRFSYERLCGDMDALYRQLLSEKNATAKPA